MPSGLTARADANIQKQGLCAVCQKEPDSDLCKAVRDATSGLIDADLGGGVIKQRIARKGSGKSAGFRTIILFRVGARAF